MRGDLENLDINQTVVQADLFTSPENCSIAGGNDGTLFDFWITTFGLVFTRLDVFVVTSEDGLVEIALPTGIKVVSIINGSIAHSPGGQPFTDVTKAVFYKVLDTDPNGSIDCTDSISGFTFAQQVDGSSIVTNENGTLFDATNGSVSYS